MVTFVNGYICEDFARRPMLLALEQIIEKANANHLTTVLISAVEKGGGILKQELVNKLASFGAGDIFFWHFFFNALCLCNTCCN